MSPKALRASVQAAGPSDGARFRFWGHALGVRAIQRELLLVASKQQQDGGSAPSAAGGVGLEEAADALFRRALFGPAAAAGAKEGRGPAPVCSGKRMLSTEGQVCSLIGGDRTESNSNLGSIHRPTDPRTHRPALSVTLYNTQEGEILRDISRTFPLEPLFRESTGVGQNLLASVLKACLAFHADVGCVFHTSGSAPMVYLSQALLCFSC